MRPDQSLILRDGVKLLARRPEGQRGPDPCVVATASTAWRSSEETWANAERLAACWNACVGVPTADLQPGCLAETRQQLACLARKVAHGCTDANCSICDSEED